MSNAHRVFVLLTHCSSHTNDGMILPMIACFFFSVSSVVAPQAAFPLFDHDCRCPTHIASL